VTCFSSYKPRGYLCVGRRSRVALLLLLLVVVVLVALVLVLVVLAVLAVLVLLEDVFTNLVGSFAREKELESPYYYYYC